MGFSEVKGCDDEFEGRNHRSGGRDGFRGCTFYKLFATSTVDKY